MRVRLGGTRRTHTRPVPALRLPAAYDVLDVPAAAGHRVLLQLERLGTPLGPVLTVLPGGPGHEAGGSRLRFFVEAGTTASFLADLKELGWEPADTDIRTIGVVLDSETPLPAAGSPRWARPPETERPPTLPPARLLLGALAYACRREEGRPVARPPLWTV
ncbi:hypothetical protein GCM10009839_76920 [Catenulispora yoronensis]|uniref:Uncharacterized protein n=1 Tax=Catenulispora yoronensis TaxID=450799 RepID=A0ABP5GT23_9ACTN